MSGPLFDAKLPADEPQLHVLLVGVSRYANLPGIPEFDPRRARETFSLRQLTSPRPSASALADWFLGKHDNPDTPLGSVELLLSPAEYVPGDAAAAANLGVAPGSVVPVPPATFDAIAQAAERWFDRLHALRENIGVFYFCGHGLEAVDRFLLAEDFATDPDDLNAGFINFQQTFVQMRRCQAATQYYLLDACRDSPDALLRAVRDGEVVGRPLLTRRGGRRPEGRNAPVIHAAAPGKPAFGPPGEKSHFASALIKCLNGMAARVGGDPGFFAVDHASLALALPEYFSRLAADSELKDLRCHTDGSETQPGLPVLHRAPAPVEVLTRIFCRPAEADLVAQLSVTNDANDTMPRPADALKPWRVTLRSGRHTVSATFAQEDGFARRDVVIDVVPTPTFDVPVRVQLLPAGGASG